jgi:hypothetical protein
MAYLVLNLICPHEDACCLSLQIPVITITHALILLFHCAFQFTIYNGPTNALVCNKTLIQMSHIKILKNHSNMFRSSDDPG